MDSFVTIYQMSVLIVVSNAVRHSDFCNNYLLHTRNITTHVSTSYGFGSPTNVYDPEQALLYSEEKTDDAGRVKIAAWTAGINNREQYWQVDLEFPSIIRGIVTQGRNGCCRQWVTAYRIYSSPDCTTFIPVKHKDGEIWEANFDENTPVTSTFLCSVKAKCIRITPETWHNHISMRFEILGCPIKPTPLYISSHLTTETSQFWTNTTPVSVATSSLYVYNDSTEPQFISADFSTTALSAETLVPASLTSLLSTSSATTNHKFSTNTQIIFSPKETSYLSTVPLETTTVAGGSAQTTKVISMPNSSSLTSYPETTVTGSTTSAVVPPMVSICTDKSGVDCSSMDRYFHICKDMITASTTCPKYCGMCKITFPTSLLIINSSKGTTQQHLLSASKFAPSTLKSVSEGATTNWKSAIPTSVSGSVSATTNSASSAAKFNSTTPTANSVNKTGKYTPLTGYMTTPFVAGITSTTPMTRSVNTNDGSTSLPNDMTTPFVDMSTMFSPNPTSDITNSNIITNGTSVYPIQSTSLQVTEFSTSSLDTSTHLSQSTESRVTATVPFKLVCAKTNLVDNWSCNFDNGPCNFNITSSPQLWNITSLKYSNGVNGTLWGGHTNSSGVDGYVLFDSQKGQVGPGNVGIISQKIPANFVLCLSFWYNMPTNEANLAVYKTFTNTALAHERLWSHHDKTTNGWEEASVILSAKDEFQVVFSSNKTSEQGYFGIDDIAVYFVGH